MLSSSENPCKANRSFLPEVDVFTCSTANELWLSQKRPKRKKASPFIVYSYAATDQPRNSSENCSVKDNNLHYFKSFVNFERVSFFSSSVLTRKWAPFSIEMFLYYKPFHIRPLGISFSKLYHYCLSTLSLFQ